MRSNHYPLIIIGAGAAGLGASDEARNESIEHIVLEASHRTGGRALTERLDNGVAVDLGCHWMHSASLNPMVEWADRLGWGYERNNPKPVIFSGGKWQKSKIMAERVKEGTAVEKRIDEASKNNSDASLWDCLDIESAHTPWYSYWYSLMHSSDPDQTAASEVTGYLDTGEDYPVRDGYGSLIQAAGAEAPVHLNSPVTAVRRDGDRVIVETSTGTLSAGDVLVTVSTGVLGAGEIVFEPPLPAWKTEAINALPLGNCNYLIYPLATDALPDAPPAIEYENDEHCAYIRVRPFGQDVVLTPVAGRFAWWLEKQGEKASEEWFRSILTELFGRQAMNGLGRFRASAWGYDPWIRGAYSTLTPGAGAMRAALAKSIDDCLWFAGEATSPNFFNTAHGAWLSGQESVRQIVASR